MNIWNQRDVYRCSIDISHCFDVVLYPYTNSPLLAVKRIATFLDAQRLEGFGVIEDSLLQSRSSSELVVVCTAACSKL